MLVRLIGALKTNWKNSLQQQINQAYFHTLNQLVSQAYQQTIVYPQPENVFRAFSFFNIEETKVVILGQDPYHNIDQANGLAFGINSTAYKIPPSLKNIAIELKNDLNVDLQDFSLTSWAQQKVLLLNTNLTVQAHQPLSHEQFGWQQLVWNQLQYLLQIKPNTIFVCWGKHAQKIVELLQPKYLITSAHPSPFSASKFFQSKPFSKVNNYLAISGQKLLSW